MPLDDQSTELLARAAQGAGVRKELLESLLDLDEAFPDFTVYGAKTQFSRRVAEILDAESLGEAGS